MAGQEGAAHITLQLVGLLCVLQAQLLWVAGGLGQGLPVAHVAGQLLAPLGLEEAGLVWAAVELGPSLSKVLLVLVVTLESADAEDMPHSGVVTDAAVPDLQAAVPQEGLFVPELQVRRAERGLGPQPSPAGSSAGSLQWVKGTALGSSRPIICISLCYLPAVWFGPVTESV